MDLLWVLDGYSESKNNKYIYLPLCVTEVIFYRVLRLIRLIIT